MKQVFAFLFKLIGYHVSKAPIKISGVEVEYNFFKSHLWIQNYTFQTIVDIGANRGQFASRFRLLFPEAEIHSFEPIPEVCEKLKNKFSKDKHFHAYQLGLGIEKGFFDFYQNDFSDSSSLLPMKSIHKEIFPSTKNETLIQIPVERLDDVLDVSMLRLPLLVKIDVQGFEEQVILGGKNTILKAKLVILEVSFYELYENQVFFDRIYSLMKDLGFRYAGNLDQLISKKDGAILQADAIFINQNLE